VTGEAVDGPGEAAIGAGPALAFDFGGTKIDVALIGEGPVPLSRTTLATRSEAGAVDAVSRALAVGRELLQANGHDAPVAVGVSTMGYTHEDGVELAPNVPGWESLQLPTILRQAFPGVPLAIDNDVRAAARAELLWGELAGVANGLYVNLGTGVAATLVVGGRIFPGSHGVAGEVGAWTVPAPAADRGSGVPEWSTLEEAVGGAGVRRRATDIGTAGGFAELLASSRPDARALAEDVLDQIAASVTNMAILVDPDRVVLGGGYTRAGELLVDRIDGSLRRHAPSPPAVVIGRFGPDAGLRGAMALARGLVEAPAVRRRSGREGTPGR
jgi:glucokinase